MDIAALDRGREDEAATAEVPEFGRVGPGPQIFDVPAEPREILIDREAVAAGRAQPVVGRIVEQGIADRRGRPLAGRLAQIAAHPQRIADGRQRPGAVGIGEEGRPVERDVVEVEPVAQAQLHIFGKRHSAPDLAAGADLLVGRVAVVVDEVEA